MQEWRFKVSGFVQGVFFRANTEMRASELGLRGFVRNEEDGSVFVVAQGPTDKLEEFASYLKEGPEDAQVNDVQISKTTPQKIYEHFSIVY